MPQMPDFNFAHSSNLRQGEGEDVRLRSAAGSHGQPNEGAPCYCVPRDDFSYMTGQVLHPNGGEIVNG
jgi:hypothetical protein